MGLLANVLDGPSAPFDGPSGTTIMSERQPWRTGANDDAKVSPLQPKIDSRVFSVDTLADALECVRGDDVGGASDSMFGCLSGL